eukprot:CAMPEP_0182447088 /NCGR_PEP_ID=MMETSP1172-20130603/11197_1 /TAXON_ID=708627 /ORGANISM="Timspurckia oligopyrenoides, Strain CCMP3278" /LENGTH=365 /DNA_ID=CAMNT_0024643373 /DNA_START=62 /DNA_END=1159 /DNA_ORIENTATION=+
MSHTLRRVLTLAPRLSHPKLHPSVSLFTTHFHYSTTSNPNNNKLQPTPQNNDEDNTSDSPPRIGAIGGFVRGLVGGQSLAAEDEYRAEAKKAGIELPPETNHNTQLISLKKRKRTADDNTQQHSDSIRDRLFSRFAGSSFIKNALDAKERISEKVEESDNPVVNFFRNIYDRLFSETEFAQVISEIRSIHDPSFTISEFVQELEWTLIPKVLKAYLEADVDTLKEYCTEDAFRILLASIKERNTEKVVFDTNILSIDNVELTTGKFLEDDPVLIVSFATQQINCLRDNAGNVVEGKEDDIRAVYYLWALVPDIKGEFEEEGPTGGGVGDDEKNEKEKKKDSDDAEGKKKGWKILEMVIRGAHSTI